VGSFVLADSTLIPKSSSAVDQFNVYASGGTRIFSNAAATSGVVLAPGGGSWSSISDREAKENIDPVDGEDVLERLAQVPIATWNYRAQDESIRHMGPMAQDLHAAFGLGPDPKTIDTIDADGVALAAIQGLDRRLDRVLEALRQQQVLIDAQSSRIEDLERVNEELRTRLNPLGTVPAAGYDNALASGER